MRVKMLTLECGPLGTFPIGAEREVTDDHGRQLVAGGYAVDVTPPKPVVVETAAVVVEEVAAVVAEEAAVVVPAETRGRRRK